MSTFAGIRSLAVEFPKTVRTNDYYRTRYPNVIAQEEQKSLAKLFARDETKPMDAFLREMAPYVDDVFRGTVERRVLDTGETALSLESAAARRAISLAGNEVRDIDLIISSSFLPDQLGVGNAVFLARELGTKCAAWNLEATCSSSIVALQTACALVRAGQYRRVLVVVSCTYSRVADEADTLSWFLGDGAAALIVSAVPEGEGLLGQAAISTTETCNTFYFEWDSAAGKTVMRCAPQTGRIIHETSESHLRAAASQALDRAGASLGDVDFVISNTPSAWFSSFVTQALGLDPSRTITTYPQYGNIGGALMPANLHAALAAGKVRAGDLVLLYGFGGVGAAAAAVVRCGEIAI